MIFVIYKSIFPNLDFENSQGISILIYKIFFRSQKINKHKNNKKINKHNPH